MNSICRRSTCYPVSRFIVPDDKVSWTIPWPAYTPNFYSADHLKNCSWADPDIENKEFKPKWNTKDGDINRQSYDYNVPLKYDVVNNYPHNPRGRTGLCGRGRLGRWGPNHAADAVVTRWKRAKDKSLVVNLDNNKPVLQFLAIQRSDCGKWAIPGGFVNANEESSVAALRELFEEAVWAEKLPEAITSLLDKFFSCGKQVYKGYVDDPRNTDNAWIETTASNYHDESGEFTDKLILKARDDAADVKWIDITKDMDIYETHCDIIHIVNTIHVKSVDKEL